MNHWSTRATAVSYYEVHNHHREDAELPPLPLALFAVNRFIYDEITELFYGGNRFAITRTAPRGLRALERFSDTVLKKMRCLLVRLHLPSCGGTCCGDRRRRCGNKQYYCAFLRRHEPLLGHSSEVDRGVIAEWERICEKLAGSVIPGRLALYVVCDCEDLETAERVVRPLLTLPVLRDCALRLRRECKEEMQGLAKETVYRVTGCSPSQAIPPFRPPFRFMDLPKELQRNVLEHTALVSREEIMYSQDYITVAGSCAVNGVAGDTSKPRTDLFKCFCYRAHSAFSLNCNRCEALGFPHALFLVSREFRAAAMEVFYGKNTFVISVIGSMGDNMSITAGLERFPKGSIRLLTSLQLSFNYTELDILQRSNRGMWKNWLSIIEILSKEANLAVLRLEIRMEEEDFCCITSDMPVLTADEYEKKMEDTYNDLVEPMCALRGLKSFFVHFYRSTIFSVPDKREQNWWQKVEGKLERMVMGEEYDAWKCGKDVE